MRITIESDDSAKVSGAAESPTTAPGETQQGSSPPEDLAVRAAAIGAVAAGPAPPDAAAEGPTTFVPEPASAETAIEDARSAIGTVSAGGAPDFAAGELIVAEADDVEQEAAREDEDVAEVSD